MSDVDVIVIGAGAAGLAAAKVLLSSSLSVKVLEAMGLRDGLARLVLLAKGQGASAAGLRFLPFSWSRRVFDLERGALREFPVSVTTWTRFPVYHTAAYLLGERRLVRMVEAVARRGLALSYPLHAVDALGLAEDGVDARLARHPGMDRPLAAKVATLDAVLGAIAARFACIPFRERLGERAPVARAS